MTFGGLPVQHEDRPRGKGYGARLGDLWLRLAASPQSPLRIYTRDTLAGRQADTSNSYENVLDIGYDFARFDFTGGEGLDQFPRATTTTQQASDATRYFSSNGLDITRPRAGQEQVTTLARKPETFYDVAGGNIEFMAASNAHLWVTDDINLRRFDDWDDVSPAFTYTPGGAEVCYKVAANNADGVLLQTDAGNFYHKAENASTFTALTNTASVFANISRWWMVKDRIIAMKHATGANEPYVLGVLSWTTDYATTTFTTFDTLQADVYEVIDAGTAILAITEDGHIRSYVPQTDTAGGAPLLTIRGISPLPGNEIPYTIAHSSGVVLVLTTVDNEDSTNRHIRAYNATLFDARFDFIVGDFQLLREWFNTEEEADQSVLGWPSIVTDRDSFWWKVAEGPAADETYIWRQDLVTRGLHRYVAADNGAGNPVYGLVLWRDHIAWSTWNGDVIRLGDLYTDIGWLITPNITHGLNTVINWISTTIDGTYLLDGLGQQLELWVSTDPTAITDWQHSSWKLITRLSNQLEGGIETPMLEISGASIALQVRMYATGTNTNSPGLNRISVRGLPSQRDFIVELPISVSDQIDAPGRVTKRIAGYGDEIYKQLLTMQGNVYELELVTPPLFMRGIIDAIAEPVPYIADRGSVGREMLLQFRGNYVPGGQTGQTVGDQALGVGLLGVATLGIGQSGVT